MRLSTFSLVKMMQFNNNCRYCTSCQQAHFQPRKQIHTGPNRPTQWTQFWNYLVDRMMLDSFKKASTFPRSRPSKTCKYWIISRGLLGSNTGIFFPESLVITDTAGGDRTGSREASMSDNRGECLHGQESEYITVINNHLRGCCALW